MNFTTIKDLLDNFINCVFCGEPLKIVIRIKDQVVPFIEITDGYCTVEYPGDYLYKSLFKTIQINYDNSIFINCDGKLNKANIKSESYELPIKISLSCKSCDKIYVVRSSELYYSIRGEGKEKIENGNLYLSNFVSSKINITQEFATLSGVDKNKCLHYCKDYKTDKVILTWGTAIKDRNYLRYNTEKEVQLDPKHFSITRENSQKIFKQIQNYNLLQ
jgi:hypothetical protein